MDKVKIILKKVGEEPQEMIIDNTLNAKQELVGGLIEVVPYNVDGEEMLIICNEEGKLQGLRANITLGFDYIAGDFFVIGDDFENGDFKSLTKKQIQKVMKDLRHRSFEYKN